MIVDVNTKAVCQIDIGSDEAFRLLCKTLHMNCILDEDMMSKLYVVEDEYGEGTVCYTRDGHDEVFDDRGDLFIGLCKVATAMFPNWEFRSGPRIYKRKD